MFSKLNAFDKAALATRNWLQNPGTSEAGYCQSFTDLDFLLQLVWEPYFRRETGKEELLKTA
jgi:hypothetical protein